MDAYIIHPMADGWLTDGWLGALASIAERAAEPEPVASEHSSDDDFDRFGIVTSSKRKKRKTISELDQFLDTDIEARVKDPLKWWARKGGNWPILQRMAMDLFSVPAMSAECERVFSQVKNIVSDKRSCLSDNSIEADNCQKH